MCNWENEEKRNIRVGGGMKKGAAIERTKFLTTLIGQKWGGCEKKAEEQREGICLPSFHGIQTSGTIERERSKRKSIK